MASEVKLPRLGQGMEAGTIVKWLKSEGDPVEKGEPLYELDTDKVTQEVEAEASGVLLRIAVAEGEVPVGETIAFIGEEGEQAPEPRRAATARARRSRSTRSRRKRARPALRAKRSASAAAARPSRSPRRGSGRRRTAAGSRRRRSPAGSRASAGSSSRR